MPLRAIPTPVLIGLAFAAGALCQPWVHGLVGDAQAQAATQAAPLAATVIDLAALRHADLPATSNPEMNARTLVLTDNATVGIQSGNVAKHLHPKTDEIQYILEGSGTMWLGGERREFRAGSLIVIPKGTAHGGSLVSSGPVKAIAIKIPPQPRDDVVFLN